MFAEVIALPVQKSRTNRLICYESIGVLGLNVARTAGGDTSIRPSTLDHNAATALRHPNALVLPPSGRA